MRLGRVDGTDVPASAIVLASCNGFEVGWVDAQAVWARRLAGLGVMASVVEFQPGRDGTDEQFVGVAVCEEPDLSL